MVRKLRSPGGALEYAVLVALCELGSGSARDIHDRVGKTDGLVYTTTAKVLDRLHVKRLVSRSRVGKAFVYRARATREMIDHQRTTTALTTLLGDEPHPAIAMLVDAVETIDPALLDELARVVRLRRSRRGT